jgi:hypothetical protein
MRITQVLRNLRLHHIKGISIAQRVKPSVNCGLASLVDRRRVFRMHMALFQWGVVHFSFKSIATKRKPEPTHIPFSPGCECSTGLTGVERMGTGRKKEGISLKS